MSYIGTLLCDSCEEQYILEIGMDLPPHWFGVQMVIADKDGTISEEKETFLHFCSQDCLADYAKSKNITEKMFSVDDEDNDDEVSDVV